MGHGFEGGRRLKIAGCSSAETNRTMGLREKKEEIEKSCMY
jgi:hypothetical protein